MGEDVSMRRWQDIADELTKESNPDRVIALAKELNHALTIERQGKQQEKQDAPAN
jgi:hypothetical protein